MCKKKDLHDKPEQQDYAMYVIGCNVYKLKHLDDEPIKVVLINIEFNQFQISEGNIVNVDVCPR